MFTCKNNCTHNNICVNKFKLTQIDNNTWEEYDKLNNVEKFCKNFQKIIVYCKNCEYHKKEQDPCHGRTEHYCLKLQTKIPKEFFCGYGKSTIKKDGDNNEKPQLS